MKLANYLIESGLSQRDFAAKVGVTSESVRLYLAGLRTPRPALMKKITEETKGAVTANDFAQTEAAQ